MNVADAIVSTPGARAASVTSAEADEGAFGALIDVAANDAGAGVAVTGKSGGDRPADAAAAIVRLPMAGGRWSGLTTRSALVDALADTSDGAMTVALSGLAVADRGNVSAPDALAAEAAPIPTPAKRDEASATMAAASTLRVAGGEMHAEPSATAAAGVEVPVAVVDTPPDAATPVATPHAAPTPSPQTDAPPASGPVPAAKLSTPRALSVASAKPAIEDVRADTPPTVSADTEGAAEASIQQQSDNVDARATQSAVPTKRVADARSALSTTAMSLPTSAAPQLAKLITDADADGAATASADTQRPAPSVSGKVKAATDDTGERQDMPPTLTATVMPIDPSVAVIAAAVPTPSASIILAKQDYANASAADGDRIATATASPRAASTEPALRGDTSRTGDLLPSPAATPRDGQVDAAVLASSNAPAPTIAQPQPAMSASPVVAAQPGRIGRELGVQIARHVADGKSEVTIRLDPANMGRVDVRLSFDDTGRLTAAVHADNPASLAMLRNEASDLGRSLTDAGIRADVSAFSFDSRHDGGGSGQPGQQPPRQPQADTRYAAGHPDDDRLSFRPLRTSDRVDLIA